MSTDRNKDPAQSGSPKPRKLKVTINRVYTKKGDRGTTGLVGGQRVRKDDARVEAYGTVDELCSFIGLAGEQAREQAAAVPELAALSNHLLRVQHELFNAGSILATPADKLHPQQPRVTDGDVEALEVALDQCNAELATLRSFVLPGGSRLGAQLHVARTVCRRAERRAVALSHEAEVEPVILRYLNRLSDTLFVWSRWVNLKLGAPEVLWDPHHHSGDG